MRVFKISDRRYLNLNEIKEFNTGAGKIFITTKDNLYSVRKNDKELLEQIRGRVFDL